MSSSIFSSGRSICSTGTPCASFLATNLARFEENWPSWNAAIASRSPCATVPPSLWAVTAAWACSCSVPLRPSYWYGAVMAVFSTVGTARQTAILRSGGVFTNPKKGSRVSMLSGRVSTTRTSPFFRCS